MIIWHFPNPTSPTRSSIDIQLDPHFAGSDDASAFHTSDGKNDSIEEIMESPKDVYVGGPAAVCAAALQAKFGDGSDVLYFHDGQRGLSNWKGSASYFHVRDAVPVYYWPDNHGAYSIYVTAKHALQRRFNLEGNCCGLDEWIEEKETVGRYQLCSCNRSLACTLAPLL